LETDPIETDTSGYFRIKIVSSVNTPRFVLNIKKRGFGLFSKIFFKSKQNGVWLLCKGSIHPIDPSKHNEIIDIPKKKEFLGPLGGTIKPSTFQFSRYLETSSSSQIKNMLKVKKWVFNPEKGIRVIIPPDSIFDENGKNPPGLVNVFLNTIDVLSPYSMPGDYVAINSENQVGFMLTYGAGIVEVWDENTEYTKCKDIRIEIPIPSHLEKHKEIPETIPFLKYDENMGVWRQIGTGEFNPKKKSYSATTNHLTAFNFDIWMTGGTCIAIDGRDIKWPSKLVVSWEDGSPSRTVFPSANDIHVIYRIPTGLTITLTAFKDHPDYSSSFWTDSILAGGAYGDDMPPDPSICANLFDPPLIIKMSIPPPRKPENFQAIEIGCGRMVLQWTGSGFGYHERYIVEGYDSLNNRVCREEVAAKNPPDPFPSLTISGLNEDETYNFFVHQEDDYSALPSEVEGPLSVHTEYRRTITVNNYRCAQITSLKINNEDVELLATEIAVDGTKDVEICGPLRRVQIQDGTDQDLLDTFEVENFDGEIVNLLTIYQKLTFNTPGNTRFWWNQDATQIDIIFKLNRDYEWFDHSTTPPTKTEVLAGYRENPHSIVCDSRIPFIIKIIDKWYNCSYDLVTNNFTIFQYPNDFENRIFQPRA
jgi:hypothetical protein